jgi:hypothetical protein
MTIVHDVDDVKGNYDLIILLIKREDVEARNYAAINKYIDKFIKDDTTFSRRSKLHVGFDGYDNDTRDVWEIPEITN